MSFNAQILEATKSAMPSSAAITVVPGSGALDIEIAWKLNDDPERPNKMSKTIRICVSKEAEEDFSKASNANQNNVYQRVFDFLSEKLAHFDPTHSVQRCEPPPVEQWIIDTQLING